MRLTEEMVIARSKQSDLNNIRRLNLWGSELTDVSIIKKMGSIEVLALSVNNISSLQAFENCYKLQELYLRRNKVADFSELRYLQKLPKLHHLWLDENPCSMAPGINYRAKVLSMLPNLVKLDDKAVTQDDLDMAERLSGEESGRLDELSPPPSPDLQRQQQEMLYEQPSPPTSRPQREIQRTPPPQAPNSRQQQQQNYLPQRQQQQHQNQQQASPQREPSPGSDLENLSQNDHMEKAPPMHPSCSTQSMKEYYQSDRPVHPPSSYRHSQMDLSEWEEQQQQQHPSKQQHHPQQHSQPQSNNHQQPQYQSTNDVYGSSQTINYAPRNSLGSASGQRNGLIGRENGDEWDDGRSGRIRRSEGRYYDSPNTASTPALHHHSGYHRRPASRSANLLSATLCLIKELDYSSLEVIEHAVRCRIDELSND